MAMVLAAKLSYQARKTQILNLLTVQLVDNFES
jgi:hypothetical protein